MDPTSFLPSTVAESIFKLLPLGDILKCCLVRSTWRNAINSDNIWKRFCNFSINLESVRSVMKCEFEHPQNEHLTPICRNRLHYMRQIILSTNFKRNRFVEYKINTNILRGISRITMIDNFRYLVLHDAVVSTFEVWDMEHEQSPFYVQTLSGKLTQTKNDQFFSIYDYLLIIQGNLLQIYKAGDGMLSLKLCRIINREETFSQSIPASTSIEAWYSDNVRSKAPGFKSNVEAVKVSDKYLFGLFRSLLPNLRLNISVMHIWDWASGKKIKVERLPDISETIDRVYFGTNSKALFIFLSLQASGARTKIYSYDTKRLQYTQFYLVYNLTINCAIAEERLILLPISNGNQCKNYILVDSVTGNVSARRRTYHTINPRIVDCCRYDMAFDSGNTVIIVDLRTSNEVAVLQVNFRPDGLRVLEGRMLLVGGASPNGNDFIEAWNITKKCKLFRLKNALLLGLGRYLHRLCVRKHDEIHVLNYW